MLEFFGKAPTRRQAGVNFAGMCRGTRLPVMKRSRQMIAEIGHYALVLALALALIQSWRPCSAPVPGTAP